MSTPATIISLCRGVRLTNRYEHTLYFSSRSEQENYFTGKVVKTLSAYSYVRKSWKLKIAETMENARLYSYLFFKNSTNGKTYYYFINNVEYINDATVELELELDVIQTYLFDFSMQRCYVEREHSVTDNIGENRIDEGLDLGEYVTASTESVNLSSNLYILMATTIDLNYAHIKQDVNNTIYSNYVDGMFGGFLIHGAPVSDIGAFQQALSDVQNMGADDAVYTMWQYPGELIEAENNTGYTEWADPVFKYVKRSKLMTKTVTGKPNTLNNYAPKNNKLHTYPYKLMYASNNNGAVAVYHYDRFSGLIQFRITGNISPDAVVKLSPVGYKGVVNSNIDESLSLTGFPLCSWNSDPYKLWLAQNQNSQNLNNVVNGIKIAAGAVMTATTGGLAAGAGVGLMASGATGIASQIAQKRDMDIQPPQARGTFNGSHNIANGWLGFTLYHKTIDYEHAQIIDDFFTMYGYATRRVKVPNISSRPYWNYVKTVGSNVVGDFAIDDITKINSIFDNGVTFWKPTVNIGDYSKDNSPS